MPCGGVKSWVEGVVRNNWVKRGRRREAKSNVKTTGLPCGLNLKLVVLSEVELVGIPRVGVKCVDIGGNTGGEGGHLGFN